MSLYRTSDLVEIGDGLKLARSSLVGVFVREGREKSFPRSPEVRKALGPAGLHGVLMTKRDKELLLVSRDVSPSEAKALLVETSPDGTLPQPEKWDLIAAQDVARVPGMGSMPMSPQQISGHVISYTSTPADEAATEYQRSIVVGTYPGPASDLGVLTWWYGDSETLTINSGRGIVLRFPAFVTPRDTIPAPTATLVAFWRDGSIDLVRTVGMDADARSSALEDVLGSQFAR